MPNNILSNEEVFVIRDRAAAELGPDPHNSSTAAEIEINARIARSALRLVEKIAEEESVKAEGSSKPD